MAYDPQKTYLANVVNAGGCIESDPSIYSYPLLDQNLKIIPTIILSIESRGPSVSRVEVRSEQFINPDKTPFGSFIINVNNNPDNSADCVPFSSIISIDSTNVPTNVPYPSISFNANAKSCGGNPDSICAKDSCDLFFVLNLSRAQVQISYFINFLTAQCGCASIMPNSQSTQPSTATGTDTGTASSATTTLSQQQMQMQMQSQMRIQRQLIPSQNSVSSSINTIMETCNSSVAAPRLLIIASNTTDGLEVSEIGVTVIDIFNYKMCRNKLIISEAVRDDAEFTLYHPEFADVIEGCGCTFVEKLINLVGYDYKLYIPILVYAIIKYTLATLIYGIASIKFLYQNFNTQFLNDLQNSRFSNFYQIFTVPNPPLYDFTQTYKYFKWSACCEANRDSYGEITWDEDYERRNQKPVHKIWNH